MRRLELHPVEGIPMVRPGDDLGGLLVSALLPRGALRARLLEALLLLLALEERIVLSACHGLSLGLEG